MTAYMEWIANPYFYGKKKLNKASPNSWIKVSALHSKDANRCFYLNREIKGADPTTFFVETRKDGWDIFAKDKKHYYLWEKKSVKKNMRNDEISKFTIH